MNYTVGYIDETGKMIIAPRFDEAYDFSEGLAYVKGEGLNAFINRSGEVVIKLKGDMWPSLEWLSYGFHEGLAVVAADSVGFIDRLGKFVFKGYTAAASFSEGLAAVAVGPKCLRFAAKVGAEEVYVAAWKREVRRSSRVLRALIKDESLAQNSTSQN